jgi:hypothetical protein
MAGMILPEAGKVQREAAKPDVVAQEPEKPLETPEQRAERVARDQMKYARMRLAEKYAKASCNYPATFKQPWFAGTVISDDGSMARVKFSCTNGFGVPSDHVMLVSFDAAGNIDEAGLVE